MWRDSTEEEQRTVDLKILGLSTGSGKTTKINKSFFQCYDLAWPDKFAVSFVRFILFVVQ